MEMCRSVEDKESRDMCDNIYLTPSEEFADQTSFVLMNCDEFVHDEYLSFLSQASPDSALNFSVFSPSPSPYSFYSSSSSTSSSSDEDMDSNELKRKLNEAQLAVQSGQVKRYRGAMHEQSSREKEKKGDEGEESPIADPNTNAKCQKPPRVRRGSATDPQSVYARKRRERINERLKILQNLVPNGTKVDVSTMLEQAIQYVKFMQLQIKLLSSDEHWMYTPVAFNGYLPDTNGPVPSG